MGTGIDGPDQMDIEEFLFNAEDQIRSIYTGFEGDLITFLKLTSLRDGVVATMGGEHLDMDAGSHQKTLSPLESVVSMKVVFKKDFDWKLRGVQGKAHERSFDPASTQKFFFLAFFGCFLIFSNLNFLGCSDLVLSYLEFNLIKRAPGHVYEEPEVE